MDKLYPVIIAFVISILMSGWIHPIIVRSAKLKNIVDNPDARKLQREPVPVLGGMAVFFGIVFGLGSMVPFVDAAKLLVLITAAMAMLYTGTMDDILNLSPMMRVMIEVLVMLILILIGGYYIDDFHGLWGIETIPYGVAVPLTLFAAIGIINAINLIDGVNGLSSGFCIIACIMFGTTFYLSGDITMTIMAAVSAGAPPSVSDATGFSFCMQPPSARTAAIPMSANTVLFFIHVSPSLYCFYCFTSCFHR